MRAARLREYHRPLELVELPAPEPTTPRDVVVRVACAGVCATGLHAVDGLMEAAGVTVPRVLGHENAGWVEAVGAGVTTVAPGDAVLVYPPYSCGLCVPSRRGNDMHCLHHEFTGLSVDGGFAELVLVDERSLLPLPDGADPAEVAPHADAGLTAYHAVKRLAGRAAPGTTAVVIGVGGRRSRRAAAPARARLERRRRRRHRRASHPLRRGRGPRPARRRAGAAGGS